MPGFRLVLLGTALLVAAATPAFADVREGVLAWERGDFERAISEWRGPARSGNLDAQYNLGQAYRLGRGVPVDLNEAIKWFEKAALRGHLRAADNYGLVLFALRRQQEAMPWIHKSAARGEPRAQYVLGTAYFNGDAIARDWVKAYAFTDRAAQQGLEIAQQRLAELDSHIPPADRQQGIALSAEIERNEASARLGALAGQNAANPARLAGNTPPSTVPAAYARSSAAPAAQPSPAPRTAAPPALASGGAWRVQLAAPPSSANARALWDTLEKRGLLGGIRPYLIDMGAFTRLRAGDFPSKAQAQAFCGRMSARGQDCFVVAPGK